LQVLFRVSKHQDGSHVGVKGVGDTRITRPFIEVQDYNGASLVRQEDRHARDGGALHFRRSRVHHIAGAYDQGEIGLGKLGVVSSISMSLS